MKVEILKPETVRVGVWDDDGTRVLSIIYSGSESDSESVQVKLGLTPTQQHLLLDLLDSDERGWFDFHNDQTSVEVWD